MKHDITGNKYGRLTAVKPTAKRTASHGVKWECICECGKIVFASTNALNKGNTRSCGCLRNELTAERNRKRQTTHGMSKSRLYRIWANMLQRCKNPKTDRYQSYGGKGVRVCSVWHEFAEFYDWAMQNGYEEALSIDRLDVNGNYEPNNCRWVNAKTQMSNKSNNRILSVCGITKTMSEWAECTGINVSTIAMRLRNGWSEERAVSKPVNGKECFA